MLTYLHYPNLTSVHFPPTHNITACFAELQQQCWLRLLELFEYIKVFQASCIFLLLIHRTPARVGRKDLRGPRVS